MNLDYYTTLAQKALAGEQITQDQAQAILTSQEIELLPLLNAAYQIRKKYWKNKVTVHIINNTQNGFCPEDCHYCAQAKTSKADIEQYPLKPEKEILAEAKNAYEKGAHRYCMVFAGRGPSDARVEKLAGLIRNIKKNYPLEVCVSAGLLDEKKAKVLKDAGLDRLNHNLNTSEEHYGKICTTHTYADRLNTLKAARDAGIQLCSGIIVGMDEKITDIIEVAFSLRKMKVESIPVNFLIPIDGNKLDQTPDLTPNFCLRVLCLFRFLNPEAEIRIAAGREIHLRGLEVMGLYPANSLFLEGYLNTKGNDHLRTLQMIKDAEFDIESDVPLDSLLNREGQASQPSSKKSSIDQSLIKSLKELRPHLQNK